MNYNYLNPLLFNYHTHFTFRRLCDAKFLLKQTAQNKQFWPTLCGLVLPIQQFHRIAFQKSAVIGQLLWSCMIALTLCVFYVSMYLKEVLLLMTGSAIDEDGSKEYSLMAATSNSRFELLLRLLTLL